MLRQRVLSALVLVPIVILATYWGGLVFFFLLLGASSIAAYEFHQLMQHRGHATCAPLVIGMVTVLLLAARYPSFPSLRLLTSLAILASLFWQLRRPAARRSIVDWALTLAGGFYLGWLAGYLILLRDLSQGLEWTLSMFIIVWTSDSAAYLIGTRWGRRPFSPQISPRKTWEGSIGGWLTALIVTILAGRFLGMGLTRTLILGLILGPAALLGDLAVSFIKRQAGAKDSSTLIPGHGGMFDRLDSIVVAAAVMYHFAVW